MVGCFHHISQWCHSAWRGWCHHKVNVKYERGSHGCQGLVGRDKFNQKCPEIGGNQAPCGTFAYAPPHQACILSANRRPQGLGMQIVNHMLPFMSLSLFVSSLGLSGTQSNGQSALRTKRALVSSVRRLLLGAAVEMSNRAEMREVLRVGWNCWHLISFHSQFWSYFCHRMFYICVGPISRHLCFSPDINHRNTTHAITRTAPCEPFVLPWQRALCLNLYRLFLSKFTFQREYRGRRCYSDWLKVFLRKCVVIAVSTITILFFLKCKSHVLKIPLMGIKV